MKKNYILITGFLLLCVYSSYGQAVSQTYSTPGNWTYTIPAGYKASITVEAWGGGGGGTGTTSGGGGGGGGYVKNTYNNLAAGTYDIIVGAGGAIGSDGGLSGYNFSGGVFAGGGSPGSGATGGGGGSISGAFGLASKTGGGGGGATVSGCGSEGSGTGGGAGGGGGGSGSSNGVGATASGCVGGAGGINYGGKGGDYNNAGAAGSLPGGGGGGRGGGAGTHTAGVGGGGLVIVTVLSSVLPVELTSFIGVSKERTINLTWATANEVNNEKFIIEAAREGEEFVGIGEIQGAGTTTEKHNYHFTHYTPGEGVNYYRLKQIDFDGTYDYSKVVAIEMKAPNSVVVFPNPAQDKLYVQYKHSDKNAMPPSLYDALGRKVDVQFFGNGGQYEVNLSGNLPRGTYWLRVEEAGEVRSIPVIKQ